MTIQQPENRQVGARGQTAVKLFFEDLGWGAIETSGEHDLGTDLLVQIRDGDLADLSLMFGVQVKTGDSWFAEPTEVEGQAGWVFREDTQKHANYWSNHPLPHILVIQNEARSDRYWAPLTRGAIEPTGKGFKVFVPASQPLDRAFRDTWIETTERALKKMVLEGSRWSFDIGSVLDADRARYALLAAHLVEPHPNKRDETPISWPEAIAVCITASAERWEHHARRHQQVPTFSDAAASDEWGWRFAAAIYQWMYHANTSPLEDLDSSAKCRQYQVAHTVATAVAFGENGRLDEAAARLADLAYESELSAEQGWLSVHRSHLAMERGDIEEARRLAQLSYAQLAPLGGDVTASSLRAAASWAMFDTAEMIPLDVGPVVSALDNPASWWRTQAVSAGLESAVKQHFRNWARDRSVILGNTGASHNALLSATVQARLAGSFAQAKNPAVLGAKIELSIPSDAGHRPLHALDSLRLAGDENGLKLAIAEIARTGPLRDLRELVDQVSPTAMTRTTSRADLRILQQAGVYAEPNHAQELADFLLSALEEPQAFRGRVAARYLVVPALLEALAGLRDLLLPAHWARLVELLMSRAQEEVSATSLQRLMRVAGLTDEDRGRLSSIVPGAPEWYQRVLRIAVGASGQADRDQVRTELLGGRLEALASLDGRIDELSAEEAAAVAAALSSSVDAERDRNVPGIFIGETNTVTDLAKVSINFPELGGWDSLIYYLGDPRIPRYRKREAALALAHHAQAIPSHVRTRLLDATSTAREQLDESVTFPTLVAEVGGAIDCLYIALLDQVDSRHDAILLSMLLGTPQQRRDAVSYLAHSDNSKLQLVQLTKDPDHEVAHIAAAGLARTIRRSSDPDPDLVTLLTGLAAQDNAIGFPIAVGLSGSGPLHADLRSITEALARHTSARVRQLTHVKPRPVDAAQ